MENDRNVEKIIKNNWKRMYESKSGNFKIGQEVFEYKVEDWEPICISFYAEKKGYELGEDEDEWWDILWEAIDDVVKEEGWDGYVYIDPDESGVSYGVTIFYKKVAKPNPKTFGEYENFPVNDRFELKQIVIQEIPNALITWNREKTVDVRGLHLDFGEGVAYEFNVKFKNAHGVEQKIKFEVYNYYSNLGIKKKEFRRIVRGVYEFLNNINYPLRVEVKTGTGGLVGSRNRLLSISVGSSGTKTSKPFFTFTELVTYPIFHVTPSYLLTVERNPKAFGLVKATPENVRKAGMNPGKIFNNDGYPVNLKLYYEALDKLTDNRKFSFMTRLYGALLNSLKKNKSLFILASPDEISYTLCAHAIKEYACGSDITVKNCSRQILETIKQVYSEVNKLMNSKEYWKLVFYDVKPYCTRDGEKTKLVTYFSPFIE